MKKFSLRVISVILCLSLIFAGGSMSVSAEDSTVTVTVEESFGEKAEKALYNVLNVIVEGIVKGLCLIYPNPKTWQPISEYDADEIGFLKGRDTYQTEAKDGAEWNVGYASRSIVPEDVSSGIYYIGRDLTNRLAKDVYDDQRIRVTAFDDQSGEGIVVMGSVDALGVTSTDARTIRKALVEYCEAKNIKVASVNISATHSHSSLDTQGVATEFVKKLFGNSFRHLLGIEEELSGLEAATKFKNFFLQESIAAVKEAVDNMETGKLYFSEVETSDIIRDKRELIDSNDLQDMPVLKFVPDNAESDATYIADITCHATTFSASKGYVTGDYIYYIDQYIRENADANFMMVAGPLGQVSKNFEKHYEGLTEYESYCSGAKGIGHEFGRRILASETWEELEPILNAQHKELFITPENSILTLACEVELVNNRVFYDGIIAKKYIMATEMGYVEFGHKIGFAMFPGELYPEVFLGNEITGGANWDGTEWPYDSMADSVDGVKVYAMSLTNDAIGYALTDNNFAFMGHIIGDGIADEVLSVGKHIGSYYIESYLEMIEDYTK